MNGEKPHHSGDSSRKRSRRDPRWWALAVALLLVLPVLPWSRAGVVLPSLSPFVVLGAWLGGGALSVWALGALAVAVACLVSRRFFCRFLCPMGVLLDGAGRMSKRTPHLRRIPRLSYVLVGLTLAGGVAGFPLFLWLDPLSLFSGLWGNAFRDLLWVVPVLVVLLGLIWPGLWCSRVCPLGATQELLHGPVNRLTAKRISPTNGTPGLARTFSLRRRTLLSSAVLVAGGGVGAWAGRQLGRPQERLRPPGAVDEHRFPALCIRCGNCLQVCPAHILRPDIQPANLWALGVPRVDFSEDYCREDCHACTQVCPSGALRDLSLVAKLDYSMGLAEVEFELCLLAYDRECEICKRVCPRDAVTFVWSEEEYTVMPQIDAERCNGCGACLVACPGENSWEREGHPKAPLRKAITIQTSSTRARSR